MPQAAPGDVTRVYERVASFYDAYTGPMETLGGREARTRPFRQGSGTCAGTGIWTAAELAVLPIARRAHRRRHLTTNARACPAPRPSNSLARGPGSCRLEKLPHPDATFDAVTAACVFCSVPDRVEGLREAAGLTRPRGLILLHEHVRPTNPLLECLADPASRSRRAFGPKMNRRTVRNVQTAERYGTSRQQGWPFMRRHHRGQRPAHSGGQRRQWRGSHHPRGPHPHRAPPSRRHRSHRPHRQPGPGQGERGH